MPLSMSYGRLAPLSFILLLAPGCGMMQRSRLDDCTRRVQALQAETVQLKDETVGLRSRNRELAQRAVEDARQIRTLETSKENLERSVVAYQEERDAMAAAFNEVQRLVHSSIAPGFSATSPPPSEPASLHRLEAFARAHPECRFDPERSVWSFPNEVLFEPRGDTLRPGGAMLIRAFGRVLSDPSGLITPSRVVSRVHMSSVQLASTDSPPVSSPDLARTRANQVKQLLAESEGIDPGAILVEVAALNAVTEDAPQRSGNVEVHLDDPLTAPSATPATQAGSP